MATAGGGSGHSPIRRPTPSKRTSRAATFLSALDWLRPPAPSIARTTTLPRPPRLALVWPVTSTGRSCVRGAIRRLSGGIFLCFPPRSRWSSSSEHSPGSASCAPSRPTSSPLSSTIAESSAASTRCGVTDGDDSFVCACGKGRNPRTERVDLPLIDAPLPLTVAFLRVQGAM